MLVGRLFYARMNMFVASRSECAASATVSIYDRAARMRREHDDTF